MVPAAAVDAKNRLWRTKTGKRRYLFNHKALAKVFGAKMLAALAAEGLALPASYPQKWVVHCKCVGSGEKALVYLGRYLYRGVIRRERHPGVRERAGNLPVQNSPSPSAPRSGRSPGPSSCG
jgi:hypothetical protein